MIGVLADLPDRPVVREFFELFKTPWEFYRSDRQYSVVLCTRESADNTQPPAPLVLAYSRAKTQADAPAGRQSPDKEMGRALSYRGRRLPLHFNRLTFAEGNAGLLRDAGSGEPVIHEVGENGAAVIRIGYDLFREVRHLLSAGQPAADAASPTLDLHIELLRDLIRSSNIQFVEVPPVPFGYRFTACLTHDVDHPSIRRHKLDHTMLGFLYRAIVGSVIDFSRGRVSARKVVRNWLAALKVPLIHLGFAADFWSEFVRYTEIECGCPSTFFVIPFRNRPGLTSDGFAQRRRGAAYGAADVAGQLCELMSKKCEVGLHGIDAWTDSGKGIQEFREIRSITGAREIGVRMHWLFFDGESPAKLEKAGASYDSTVGYNETIGYRAGTSQMYKPLNAAELLELPLLMMDTALFYPAYLHLSPRAATARINEIIDTATEQGGCVTVNWHDRSIAPERLWTDTYVRLIEELKRSGAWFATASQATSWFRMRRSIRFERDANGKVQTILTSCTDEALPTLIVRTHAGSTLSQDVVLKGSGTCGSSHRDAQRWNRVEAEAGAGAD